jgi:hypothetical protein
MAYPEGLAIDVDSDMYMFIFEYLVSMDDGNQYIKVKQS